MPFTDALLFLISLPLLDFCQSDIRSEKIWKIFHFNYFLCYILFLEIPCGCGGIGIRARLRCVWLCLASSSLAIRIFFSAEFGGVSEKS